MVPTEALETNVVNEVLVVAIQTLAAVVLAVITYYGRKLLQKLDGKVSAETMAEAERFLSMGAGYAVDFAEEKARAWALSSTERMTSLQKLDAAAEWFRTHYREQVADWTERQVKDFILARLGGKRFEFGLPAAAVPKVEHGDGLADPTELRD